MFKIKLSFKSHHVGKYFIYGVVIYKIVRVNETTGIMTLAKYDNRAVKSFTSFVDINTYLGALEGGTYKHIEEDNVMIPELKAYTYQGERYDV